MRGDGAMRLIYATLAVDLRRQLSLESDMELSISRLKRSSSEADMPDWHQTSPHTGRS
jgi:hypothetical protein